MALTILDGSTFCLSDEHGDIGSEETSGFFASDVRFLSSFRLLVEGRRPLLLASRRVEYFSAAFYLRNPLTDTLDQDVLLIERSRVVARGLEERITIANQSLDELEVVVELEVAADFADMFAVKDRDFALGDPKRARPLPAPVTPRWTDGGRTRLVFEETGGDGCRTELAISRPSTLEGDRVGWHVRLSPRAVWEVVVAVDSSTGAPREARPTLDSAARPFGAEQARVSTSLAAWRLHVPRLRATWEPLEQTFRQSVSDLAALRLHSEFGPGQLFAAGMPWFMTVFGRDTIITCLQTLLFGPELARTALRVLAELQATEDDPTIDAEPGKIVHELRSGKAGRAWFERYYGTVDATPLFLVLLSEVWRWTDDLLLVRDLRAPALQALENQSWKDSHDSQRFADGRFASTPIAPCEVQGYVYDAKLRLAELARHAWRDRGLATRLEREAAELRRRFDDAFWIERRGGYYALALDGEKQPVDSLCSNVGHLLWSGIVPPERVDAICDALLGEALWSGWGVRTMSTEDAAYNPLSYHDGSIWPHDNSLIAWGLVRYGRWREARRIARRLLEAAGSFDHQLPEVFAGLRRTETPFPVPYPTAARPQAWAAGAPVLLLRLLLGLQPDTAGQTLVSVAPAQLPPWLGEVELTGVPAFDRRWDVRTRSGQVVVERVA